MRKDVLDLIPSSLVLYSIECGRSKGEEPDHERKLRKETGEGDSVGYRPMSLGRFHAVRGFADLLARGWIDVPV